MSSGLKSFVLSFAFLFATASHAAPVSATPAKLSAAMVGAGDVAWKSGASLHAYRQALRVPMIVEGVTNQGWIVGRWLDPKGNSHWFLMNPFLPAFTDIANHESKPQVQVFNLSDS